MANDSLPAPSDLARYRKRGIGKDGNILAESLVIALDLEGYEVSSGSACSSGKVSESHVLTAMGLDSSIVKGSIRISLCRSLDETEILLFCNTLYKIIQKLLKKDKVIL